MSDKQELFLGTNHDPRADDDDYIPPSDKNLYELECRAYERGLMDGWDAACGDDL